MQWYRQYKGLAAATALLLALAGCGGSGNPGSTEVEILSDADAVVYEKGDGVWRDDLVAEATLVNGKSVIPLSIQESMGWHCIVKIQAMRG